MHLPVCLTRRHAMAKSISSGTGRIRFKSAVQAASKEDKCDSVYLIIIQWNEPPVKFVPLTILVGNLLTFRLFNSRAEKISSKCSRWSLGRCQAPNVNMADRLLAITSKRDLVLLIALSAFRGASTHCIGHARLTRGQEPLQSAIYRILVSPAYYNFASVFDLNLSVGSTQRPCPATARSF